MNSARKTELTILAQNLSNICNEIREVGYSCFYAIDQEAPDDCFFGEDEKLKLGLELYQRLSQLKSIFEDLLKFEDEIQKIPARLFFRDAIRSMTSRDIKQSFFEKMGYIWISPLFQLCHHLSIITKPC